MGNTNKHLTILKSLILSCCLILCSQFLFAAKVPVKAGYPEDLPYAPAAESREELYQDVFISLLLPHIQKEIDRYYSKYLSYPPMVAPYTVYVISTERQLGYRSFLFKLKIRVESYVGPHIGVGTENITFIIGGSGDVKVEKFEHVRSYVLPPNYENMIKRGYKNPIP